MGPDRILIAGGSGVFGRQLARELLATTEARLIIAGRDVRRAESACRNLGDEGRVEPMGLDLADPASLERAARGCVAVACTAGPFQRLPSSLPATAVRAGAHWLDIADSPGWVLQILNDGRLDRAARAGGMSVMTGLSSVPSVSGTLARWCHARLPEARHGSVTLFIGNRNEKGAGATASALISGFRDPAFVTLPTGRRWAHRFPTPDAELFRRDLGLDAEFRVALEWAYLGRWAAALGRLTPLVGERGQTGLARWLSKLSRPFGRFGTDTGIVQVEVWDDAGETLAAAAIAGQRLVILPCALALQGLLDGRLTGRGVLHPAAWLPVDEILAGLRWQGIRLMTRRYTRRRR